MKENKYILTKIFKKHTIALLLTIVLLVLCLVSVFNRADVYAAELVANVKYDVFVVNGEEKEIVNADVKTISNLDQAIINFGDINVELDRFSKLEFVYELENINVGNTNFVLSLNESFIENFRIEYYLNDEFCGDLTQIYGTIKTMETVNIKVVVYVENIACDAALNGSLELTFESVGENND